MFKRLVLLVFLLVGVLAVPFVVSPVRAQTPITVDATIYSSTNDGYIYNYSSTYTTAWGDAAGTIDSSSDYVYVGQKKTSSGTYYIYRGFLLFSMDDLPSDAVINSACLGVMVSSLTDLSGLNFTLTICDGQPTYPHNPLQTSDYNTLLYTNASSGNATSTVTVGSYLYVNYTATDLTYIGTSGTTKVTLRSDKDIGAVAPTAGLASTNKSELVVYSRNKGESYAPKLLVNYTTMAYTYVFHGPFLETGYVSTDNVTVTCYPTGVASSTFTMPENSSFTHGVYFSGLLNHFTYNITSPTYNMSRVYYVESTETDFYLFLPKSTDTFDEYSFQIVDLAGMGAGYISSNLNINGTSRTVEKVSIDLYNYMNFWLVKGNAYDIKVSAELGVFTDANFVAAELTTKKEIITGDMFAISLPSNPLTVAAARMNSTWVQANYSNTEATTDWIEFTIQYLSGYTWTTSIVSNNTLNATSLQYNWYSANNVTDYRMTIQASISSTINTWMFDLSAPVVKTSPFDLTVLGTFGPFPASYVVGFILVCISLGCFTAYDLSLGCTVTWIIGLFLTYLGWLPNATSNWILMGFAGVFVVFVDIKEAKKVEREI